MIFKYVVLKRPCTELGTGTVLIRNDETKNGVFCTNTGGVFLNSTKNESYLYIPSHNISFVAFEIVKKEDPKVEVKEAVAKPKLVSVKGDGAGSKANNREVSKARTPARKSTRPTKTTRKSATKDN